MRHGEAERRAVAGGDAERALTPRGVVNCSLLAETLAADGQIWDVILCSSTRRARESAEGMARAIASSPEVDVRDALNLAGMDALLAELRSLPDKFSSVLLVAHNPGVHALVLFLSGTSGGRTLRRAARDFPAGALARLTFDGESWARLAPGVVELRDFFTPRDMS